MDASTAGANLAEAIARSRPQTAARLKYGTVMQVRDGSLLVSVDGGSATARRVTRWPYEAGDTVILLAQGRVLQALLPTTAEGMDEERMQQVEAAASEAQDTAESASTAAQSAQATAAQAQSEAQSAQSAATYAQDAADAAQETATAAQTAATQAQSAAEDAEKVATNWLDWTSGTGLVVGDLRGQTLLNNTLIDANGVAVRSGSTELARFGASTVQLGKNSASSVIEMCGGVGSVRSVSSQIRVGGTHGAYLAPGDITDSSGIGLVPDGGAGWKVFASAGSLDVNGYATDASYTPPEYFNFKLNGSGQGINIGFYRWINPFGVAYIGSDGTFWFPPMNAWNYYESAQPLPRKFWPPAFAYALFPLANGSAAIQVNTNGVVRIVYMDHIWDQATMPAALCYPVASRAAD